MSLDLGSRYWIRRRLYIHRRKNHADRKYGKGQHFVVLPGPPLSLELLRQTFSAARRAGP